MNPKIYPIYEFHNFSNDRSSFQNDQLTKNTNTKVITNTKVNTNNKVIYVPKNHILGGFWDSQKNSRNHPIMVFVIFSKKTPNQKF